MCKNGMCDVLTIQWKVEEGMIFCDFITCTKKRKKYTNRLNERRTGLDRMKIDTAT